MLPRVLLPSCFLLPHRANTRRDTKGTHAATQDEHWKRPPHNIRHQNLFCGLASARSMQSSGFCSSSWLPSGSSMSLAHVCLWYSQSFFWHAFEQYVAIPQREHFFRAHESSFALWQCQQIWALNICLAFRTSWDICCSSCVFEQQWRFSTNIRKICQGWCISSSSVHIVRMAHSSSVSPNDFFKSCHLSPQTNIAPRPVATRMALRTFFSPCIPCFAHDGVHPLCIWASTSAWKSLSGVAQVVQSDSTGTSMMGAKEPFCTSFCRARCHFASICVSTRGWNFDWLLPICKICFHTGRAGQCFLTECTLLKELSHTKNTGCAHYEHCTKHLSMDKTQWKTLLNIAKSVDEFPHVLEYFRTFCFQWCYEQLKPDVGETSFNIFLKIFRTCWLSACIGQQVPTFSKIFSNMLGYRLIWTLEHRYLASKFHNFSIKLLVCFFFVFFLCSSFGWIDGSLLFVCLIV